MAQKIKKLFFIILILLFLSALGGGTYCYLTYNASPREWAEENHLLIEEGMTVSSIGRDLENRGVIGTYYLFRIYHEVFGRSNTMPTGSYTLYPGMTTVDIYRKLVRGEQDMLSVTVPEGWTQRLIAERLEKLGICDEEDFSRAVKDSELLKEYGLKGESFEGYLFPDTYRFVYGESSENVLRAMVENFFNNLDEIYPDWSDLTQSQLQDKVTMASIVEKEYRLDEEAPLIASVFYNRLDDPEFPLLQSCATLVYVITEKQGKKHPERLFYRDLEIDDPYNTYFYSDLPPGAIANPGYTALNAAFNPADTDYYFFVVKDSRVGSHNFSSNYGDFLDDKDYFNSFRSK